MRGINSRFVRVYTDQGLTGTGETLDTIGAEDIINKFFSPGLAGRDPLDIEAIYWDLWSFRSMPGAIPSVFMRGNGGGPYIAAVSGVEMALVGPGRQGAGASHLPADGRTNSRQGFRLLSYRRAQRLPADVVQRTGVRGIKTYYRRHRAEGQ